MLVTAIPNLNCTFVNLVHFKNAWRPTVPPGRLSISVRLEQCMKAYCSMDVQEGGHEIAPTARQPAVYKSVAPFCIQ
jgi:hypothetical protein